MEAKSLSRHEEANAIVGHVLRNGFLEDLHAGKPSKVLQRPGFSRITDDEMKKLMIECSAKMAELLRKKDEEPEEYLKLVHSVHDKYTKGWDTG